MNAIQQITERTAYPAGLAELMAPDAQMPLGPGQPSKAAEPALQSVQLDEAFAPQRIRDTRAAQACLSGLWLLHNFLDRAHEICQALDTAEGSYWHAIVHRREPDFSNSKYWFRRTGRHAIFDELRKEASTLAASYDGTAARMLHNQKTWDAAAFVDLCESCIDTGSDDEMLCEQVQMLEWHLLFEHCYRAVIGD